MNHPQRGHWLCITVANICSIKVAPYPRPGPAICPSRLKRVARIMYWMRERDKEWFYALSLYLVDRKRSPRWRLKAGAPYYGKQLRASIGAWADFEAAGGPRNLCTGASG